MLTSTPGVVFYLCLYLSLILHYICILLTSGLQRLQRTLSAKFAVDHRQEYKHIVQCYTTTIFKLLYHSGNLHTIWVVSITFYQRYFAHVNFFLHESKCNISCF